MPWKVYSIDTGATVKAGFKSEDAAKDWLEEREQSLSGEYEVEEMDHDEVVEWREKLEALDKDDEDDGEDDLPLPDPTMGYGDQDDDDYYNPDDEYLTEVFDED